MAKFGIALGSGPRGRGFESRHSDHSEIPLTAPFPPCGENCAGRGISSVFRGEPASLGFAARRWGASAGLPFGFSMRGSADIYSVSLLHVGANSISLATTFLCFALKVISRSFRCSSFPNRTRFAGLRFGFQRSNPSAKNAIPSFRTRLTRRSVQISRSGRFFL